MSGNETAAPPVAVDPDKIELLCDAADDAWLFRTVKAQHPHLSRIPDENVRTYQQARVADRPTLEQAITPLHQDDRPDWIFCYDSQPVLVVELTRHAYTGDNGLQRFARFAAAAESGVPFVYFGPLRRVRDDELDRPGRASPRSLTSDVFEGMSKLSSLYDVPQLYAEWSVDASGLPATLPIPPTREAVLSIHGDLLEVVDMLLFRSPLCLVGRPLANPDVATRQDATRRLAGETNTRESDVRFEIDPATCRRLLEAPASIIPRFDAFGYFHKGKPDKLLARYALDLSEIKKVQLPNGEQFSLTPEVTAELLNRLFSIERFQRDSFVYYTGYKWRSDPHCGVLVSLDYRRCRSGEHGPERDKALIVLYPRISLDATGQVWEQLKATSSTCRSRLAPSFEARYGADAEIKMDACLQSAKLFSPWSNGTKQARLFRRYADVVVLNDGLVLGDGLAADFAEWKPQ